MMIRTVILMMMIKSKKIINNVISKAINKDFIKFFKSSFEIDEDSDNEDDEEMELLLRLDELDDDDEEEDDDELLELELDEDDDVYQL